MKTFQWLFGIMAVALIVPLANAAPQISVYEVCQAPKSSGTEKTLNLSFYAGTNIYSEPEPVCLIAHPIAEGALVKTGTVATDSVDHLFGLVLTLTPKGREVISVVTRKYSFKRIAWVVDSQIISLASIVEPIDGGTIEIRGIGKYAAERIASVINGKR